jgi:wyosine [tRNA(Phe)-imidazoG37] synthetase (radical SAM superfamily)
MTDYQTLAFGPVPSRRLGLSVGVNTVPMKTCTYSCVYCQLGPTTDPTIARRPYYEPDSVVRAALECIDRAPRRPDYVTFIGQGEPSLASNMGEINEALKAQWNGSTALLTNGSLLWDPRVQESSLAFDVVLPTVSACNEEMFRRIHRPHQILSFKKVMEGITSFSESYSGQLWIETMLIAGVNDDDVSLQAIGELLKRIKLDRVHVAAPIRPPSEKSVRCPPRHSIELALEILPRAVDTTSPEGVILPSITEDVIRHLLDIASVHPLREDQAINLIVSSGRCKVDATAILDSLVKSSYLERSEYAGRVFYTKTR